MALSLASLMSRCSRLGSRLVSRLGFTGRGSSLLLRSLRGRITAATIGVNGGGIKTAGLGGRADLGAIVFPDLVL